MKTSALTTEFQSPESFQHIVESRASDSSGWAAERYHMIALYNLSFMLKKATFVGTYYDCFVYYYTDMPHTVLVGVIL
jgi:hypothetical protein